MSRPWNASDRRWKLRWATARVAAAACALLIAASAVAQETQPGPQPEPQQPPAFQPGFLDSLGRWLGDSKTRLDEQFKTTTDAAKEAADAAGHATGALLGWPGSRIVNGRERCAIAPNGAPDCTPAAEALCRSKGLGGGKGLDINSAQKCPTWVWLSGRPPPEGVCTPETFVLRALCQ